MTLQETYILAMKVLGNPLKKVTSKATVFEAKFNSKGKPIQKEGTFYYYIGKSGSVRLGETYAESLPIHDWAKTRMKDLALANTPEAKTKRELGLGV